MCLILLEYWQLCNDACLQVESLDIIITIVKIWLNDLSVNCMLNENMKNYLKAERILANDNYKLIEETTYFEDLNVDGN